jgi:hypothetical protein
MKIPIDFKKILRYFNKDKVWQIIIIAFMLLFVALVSVNVYFYRILLSSVENQVVAEVKLQEIQRSKLEQVVKELEERGNRFNQNILIKTDIKDPSL